MLQDIRILHQPPDALTKLLGIGGVQLSIIAHHRIYDYCGTLGGKLCQKLLYQFNLIYRTKESRKDPLKFQIELFPLRHIGRHGIGEILDIKALKARMIGKNSGGQRAALDSKVRDQRQRHSNGASAKAGKVIDDRNFFLVIMGQGTVPPFRIMPPETPKAPPDGGAVTPTLS